MPVAVVTDSQSCLPEEWRRELGITVLPYVMEMDGHLLRDGVDIDADEFYRRLPLLKRPPTTSAITPAAFLGAFEELKGRCDGILVVTISSRFSSTFDNARLAAGEWDGTPVEVVDSRTAAAACGMVARRAAERAANGGSLAACRQAAEEAAEKVELLACVDGLEQLRRSGRVSALRSMAAGALSIKPVLRIQEGEARLEARRRSVREALGLIASRVEEAYRRDGLLLLSVFHAASPGAAAQLEEMLERRGVEAEESVPTRFTPMMGSHTGPGITGAAFLPA
jgi:DegV family protein with EDD domain